MNNNIVPGIVKDSAVREMEAIRLANEVFVTEQPNTIADIARYGEFIANNQAAPREALVDFHRTVAILRPYQEMILPLRGLSARLDHFDEHFSMEVFRLAQAEV